MRRLTALAALALAGAPRLAAASPLTLPTAEGHVLVVNDRAAGGGSPLALVRANDPRAAGVTLVETRREAGRETFVRLAQTHLGLPVLGRGAVVRYDAAGRATVTSSLATDLPASAAPGVSRGVALRRYEEATGRLAADGDVKLAFYTGIYAAPRLAYLIAPPEDGVSPARFQVVVDAATGEVLERRDLRVRARAKVHATNPTKSPALAFAPFGVEPDAGSLVSADLHAYNCVDKKSVKRVSFSGFAFDAHTCDLINVATPNGDGDYDSPPDESAAGRGGDAYSEVSMYYHSARAYAFFRELRGEPAAQVVRGKPLAVIANLQLPPGLTDQNLTKAANPNEPLEPFQNAFFSPAGQGQGDFFAQLYGVSGDGLWFGQGPRRDYAYDGDVVYHEFTHAVVDATIQLGAVHLDRYGLTYAPGAMNEGLADYFSSALAGDPDVGEYASADISQNSGVIRTLANAETCPNDVFGEVHRDSTLFSGGLWSARQSLPEGDRRTFDATLYAALRAHPGDGDLDYADLTQYFLRALKTALPAGATALEKEMTTRGVLGSCDRIFTVRSGEPVRGARVTDTFGGWYATGRDTIGLRTVPGIAQFRVATGGKAGKVHVSFDGQDLGQGFGGGFGGGAGPFKPQVLVRFGKPVEWKASGSSVTATTDASLPLAAAGPFEADVTVPADGGDVYVQIANVGGNDGVYDAVTLTFTADAVTPEEPPPPVTPPVPVEDTFVAGGGCAVGGGDLGSLFGLCAPLSALLLRRRRR